MHTTDRRTLLKGITLGAGATVLQPVLNAIGAEASGNASPQRIIFFVEGNGMSPAHIQPQRDRATT